MEQANKELIISKHFAGIYCYFPGILCHKNLYLVCLILKQKIREHNWGHRNYFPFSMSFLAVLWNTYIFNWVGTTKKTPKIMRRVEKLVFKIVQIIIIIISSFVVLVKIRQKNLYKFCDACCSRVFLLQKWLNKQCVYIIRRGG